MIKELEKTLKLKIDNPKLYEQAFVHRSYINESDHDKNNERLEFLGDAVLELITTEALYEKFPNQPEGKLTSFRSALVKGENLAEVARKLNLGKYLKLSKGEEKSGGREKNYILANTVEAIIGAIYLDQGYETSKIFIKTHILPDIEDIINLGLHVDPKTKFQELAQEHENITPEYKVIKESGPDHKKNFTMGVYLEDNLIAQGSGSSKQKAEAEAAQKALELKGWLN